MRSESWDLRYMRLAQHVAEWSKDPSTQVGAVIVGRPGEVSLGYNGFPRGIRDMPERLTNKELKYKFTQHAERNVLDNTRFDTHGSTLYVTMYPCSECAKSIVSRGIRRLVCPPPVKVAPWSEDARFSEVILKEGEVEVKFI